jgi:hypothetical protein
MRLREVVHELNDERGFRFLELGDEIGEETLFPRSPRFGIGRANVDDRENREERNLTSLHSPLGQRIPSPRRPRILPEGRSRKRQVLLDDPGDPLDQRVVLPERLQVVSRDRHTFDRVVSFTTFRDVVIETGEGERVPLGRSQ